MQQIFKVGDRAVVPGIGVGEVTGIEHQQIAGQRQAFYVLRIRKDGAGQNVKYYIPINKAGSSGLREIISKDDVKQVYSIVKEKQISVDSTTGNPRDGDDKEDIKTWLGLHSRIVRCH